MNSLVADPTSTFSSIRAATNTSCSDRVYCRMEARIAARSTGDPHSHARPASHRDAQPSPAPPRTPEDEAPEARAEHCLGKPIP